MHILAVRTGLLALYFAMTVLGLRYALLQQRYLLLIGITAGVVLLPLLAYQFIPSLQAKIDYVRYDYWKHQRGEGGLYADSGRIASLQVGWDIVRGSPYLGTGAGGLRSAVAQKFTKEYPQYPNPLMPHNQYLYVAAATGLIGLLFFMLAFFFPLFYRGNYRYPPLLGLYVMLAVVFMIEHSLENSLGAGYAAFFLLLFLSYLGGNARTGGRIEQST
jgi:O-antigen ligase